MYYNFEKVGGRDKGIRMTFFTREVTVKENGQEQRVNHTENTVYATLSEGIKTGENNGVPIWENDYWQTVFRGKAYQKALNLKDKDRIILVEYNIRNKYYPSSKKSYPQITVFDFDIYSPVEGDNKSKPSGREEFMNIPDNIDEEVPFK